VESSRLARIAALDQPVRLALHRLLAGAPGSWVSRDQAAAALELPRSVAAFHLDKLEEAGVVEVRFERPSGRSGPGAGRPAKRYRLVDEELSASVPERHYDLAGGLLASAVAESARTGTPVATCLRDAARREGRAIGRAAAGAISPGASGPARRQAIVDVLADHGYEPSLDGRKQIVLGNCPFHRLAEQHRDLVCGMNLDFLDGLVDGLGQGSRLRARLQPEPGRCCVRIGGTA
jgi:predicted ArsR family transcriptional regulator